MSVGIPVHENTHTTIAERSAFFEQILNKVAQTPGVRMAAISTNATPPDNGRNTEIELLGSPSTAAQMSRLNLVSQSYFPVLRIPLDRGRLWTEAENHQAAKVAVVNESFARKFFPKGDVLGHSVKSLGMKNEPPYFLTADGADGWLQIVGVIADKLDDGLSRPVIPEFFVPYTLAEPMHTQILVRADGPPTALLHTIGRQVNLIDPDQQINGQTRDLEHWISTQTEYAQGKLVAWLFGGFAALALTLAAVGLYSVVSYSVAQRTNEFGIRMALGAMRRDVLALVFRATAVSVGSGVAGGITLSLLLRAALTHWAGASGSSAGPLLLAVLVLTTVALIASGIPAQRATRIEPMEALRYE